MSVTGRLMCRAIAERTGRQENDLEVRVHTRGPTGALLEAAVYWTEHDYRGDLLDLLDRALATFTNLPER